LNGKNITSLNNEFSLINGSVQKEPPSAGLINVN